MLLLTVVLLALSFTGVSGNACSSANEGQFCTCRTDNSPEDCGALTGVVVGDHCVVGPYQCSQHSATSGDSWSSSWSSSSSSSWSSTSDAGAVPTGTCSLPEFYAAFTHGAPAASCPDGDCDNYAGLCSFSGAQTEGIVPAGDKCCVNAPPPSFSIAPLVGTGPENAIPAKRTFRITKTGGPAMTPHSVQWMTVDGTGDNGAKAGSDFTGVVANPALPVSITGPGFVDIEVLITADTICEKDETFTVKLVNPSMGTSITVSEATGTIQNDDACAKFSITPPTATAEGAPGTTKTITFVVTKVEGTGAADVSFTTTDDGTASVANNDFVAKSGVLSFPEGALLTQTISVTVNGDGLCEDDETVKVMLTSATNLATFVPDAFGTITNDDACASFSISAPVATAEGNTGMTTFTFTVTKIGTGPANVQYRTADGTATVGSDYLSTTGPLVFAAGETTKSVTVTVLGDTTCEPNETFKVELFQATNFAVLGTSSATGTINNDDSCASFTIGDASVTEGNTGTKKLTFTITKTGTNAASVDYVTADSVPAVSATAGGDYVSVPTTTVSFTGAGTETKTIDVTINGDTTCEPNETFRVLLSNPTNAATIGDGEAIGTITNDDICPCTTVGAVCDDGNAATTNDKCVTATVCGGAVAANNINAVGDTVAFFVGDDGSLFRVPVGNAPSTSAPFFDKKAKFTFEIVIPRAVACDVQAIWYLDGKPIATDKVRSSKTELKLNDDANGSLRRGFHLITVELRTAPSCVASLTPFTSNVKLAFN